mmetsp:Transcript_72548/g.151452  ORF Transcript_72548/g.151452 Transcript_72548/m.151452 type:complete len:111 (-) Transcript_72548:7-339(-)
MPPTPRRAEEKMFGPAAVSTNVAGAEMQVEAIPNPRPVAARAMPNPKATPLSATETVSLRIPRLLEDSQVGGGAVGTAGGGVEGIGDMTASFGGDGIVLYECCGRTPELT